MAKKKIQIGPIIGCLFVAVLFTIMLLSGFGVIGNFWGWDASQTEWGWKLLMVIILIVPIALIVLFATNRLEFQKGHGFLLLLLFSLGFGASTGFKFTAGDIGQRISAFKADGSFQPSDPNDGKVTGKEVIFKYYSEFYKLDTDTALVNYINTYNEFPGVNDNYYRQLWLRGDTINGVRPSKAPRANETFQLHSHNDNSVYKKYSK